MLICLKNLIPYNLLFFGGRHPLCGIDVLSSIERIFNPADLKARIEVSRPFPLRSLPSDESGIATRRPRLCGKPGNTTKLN